MQDFYFKIEDLKQGRIGISLILHRKFIIQNIELQEEFRVTKYLIIYVFLLYENVRLNPLCLG